MLKLSCVYWENPGSGSSYSSQAVNGRCRLHSIVSAGDSSNHTSIIATSSPIIVLYDGSSISGDSKIKFCDTLNSNSNQPYGGNVVLDIPGGSILFTEGIFIDSYDGNKGVSLIISGGLSA